MFFLNRFTRPSLVLLTLFLLGMSSANFAAESEVAENYAEIAYAIFSDSLSEARVLDKSINDFLANPSSDGLGAAKQAWLAARVPYGQSEVFRFGNPNVDDWEGSVNAWPLDEGLIDYVSSSYVYEDGNGFGAANIISTEKVIDAALLQSYHEKGGSEANVATGYHAIEFLLWGQDLNANKADSGLRPFTDYSIGKECTNGHCEARGEYLKAASALLINDLEVMVADWKPGANNYRKEFVALPVQESLRRILFGMGSLSLGELAGERINVALLAHSQEDEHSCFSDNTSMDIYLNALGIQNVFLGKYKTVAGNVISGKSLEGLVAKNDKAASKAMADKLAKTMNETQLLVDADENFDQQIVAGNAAGNARVNAVINALKQQTVNIEEISKIVGVDSLNPETSDSFGG